MTPPSVPPPAAAEQRAPVRRLEGEQLAARGRAAASISAIGVAGAGGQHQLGRARRRVTPASAGGRAARGVSTAGRARALLPRAPSSSASLGQGRADRVDDLAHAARLVGGTETPISQNRGRSGKGRSPWCTCMRPSSAQRCSCREHLAGIEQPVGIEGAFQPLLLGQIDLVEHLRHQVALLDAHAVLAGQHAADLDAEAQDVGAERLGPLQLARLVGVVEDQRMQIAVAGVEDVGDAAGRSVSDSSRMRCSTLGSWRARDGAVHAVVVGRDAADGREAPPCARPRTARARPRRRRRVSCWPPLRWRDGQRPGPSDGRTRPPARPARRSAAPRRRADSRHGRRPRRRGSPACPSSPCRPG